MDYEKKYKEAIELIQRSWYMEGYHDCEFGYEPKWIIKTGEGGPRYEENPKYGQIIEEKPKFYPGDVIKCTSIGSLWVRCKGGDNIRSDGHTACIGGGFELASEEETMQFFHELTENGYQWDCIKGRPIKKEQKPELYYDKELDIAAREFYLSGGANSPVDSTGLVPIVRMAEFGATWMKERMQKEQKHPDGCFTCDEYKKGYEEGRRNGFTAGYNKAIKEVEQKEQKPAEKQDYSGLTELKQAIHRGFLCAGVVNVPVNIIKETAQDCLAHLPAEWSEEDEHMRNALWNLLKNQYAQDYSMTGVGIEAGKFRDWLKSLRPQPKQEWSDEDEQWLESIIGEYEERLSVDKDHAAVIQIKIDFLKSLRPQYKFNPNREGGRG